VRRLGIINEANLATIQVLSIQFDESVLHVTVGLKLHNTFVLLQSVGISKCHLSCLAHKVFQILLAVCSQASD